MVVLTFDVSKQWVENVALSVFLGKTYTSALALGSGSLCRI